MTTIKNTLQRLLHTAALTLATAFDRGVGGILGEFDKLTARLDRFVAGQEAIVDMTAQAASASFRRLQQVRAVEDAFRDGIYKIEDAALEEASRARRVRDRLAKLID